MSAYIFFGVIIVVCSALLILRLLFIVLRSRGIQRCAGKILKAECQYIVRGSGQKDIHVLLCVADHFEPFWGNVSKKTALARVNNWLRTYPESFGNFQDSDGYHPKHTFFFPADEYDADCVNVVAELCHQGFGEMEIHLHHQNDTSKNFRDTLCQFRDLLAFQHRQLAFDPKTQRIRYGFVHGNWTLCNWHGNGRFCGVQDELTILQETGCYADFTMPSAPSKTQCPVINKIYYARTIRGIDRSHEYPVTVKSDLATSLMMIPGPLVFNWQKRRWGIFPSLENGCLQESQPPEFSRLSNWIKAGVSHPNRPDWFFVKLHAHGGPETDQNCLLGQPMIKLHEDLANLRDANPNFHYHYVTAREMYNLAKSAEDGWPNSVDEARDSRLLYRGNSENLRRRSSRQGASV